MLLQSFDFSINLMTLLALVLAIGLVVDDAMWWKTNRHIKLGETPFRAAMVRVKLPSGYFHDYSLDCGIFSMALMGGITGTLFKEFALTLAGAVFISGISSINAFTNDDQ